MAYSYKKLGGYQIELYKDGFSTGKKFDYELSQHYNYLDYWDEDGERVYDPDILTILDDITCELRYDLCCDRARSNISNLLGWR